MESADGHSTREERGASSRKENVCTRELTPDEIEAILGAEPGRAVVGRLLDNEGTTAYMGHRGGEGYEDYEDYGDYGDYELEPWQPSWGAPRPPAPRLPASRAGGGPRAGEEDSLAVIEQITRDVEIAVATLDDTTVEVRDRVRELTEDVKTTQAQITDIEECVATIRAQNAVLMEELRELRREFMQIHQLALDTAGSPSGPAVAQPWAP